MAEPPNSNILGRGLSTGSILIEMAFVKKAKENQREAAVLEGIKAALGPDSVQNTTPKSVGFDIHHHRRRILRYLEKGAAESCTTASPFNRL
jgi:hypothetical protein